jgi:hypothetical protein
LGSVLPLPVGPDHHRVLGSVLPLPVGPNHHSAKKVLILTMKLWKMKKSSDFDHEIMNLVETNVGTPAILVRTLSIC